MIASFLRNFIFIKQRKVAGTSLEMALAPHCGPLDIITRISPQDEAARMHNGAVLARNYSTSEAEKGYAAAINAGPSQHSLMVLRSLPPDRFYNHMPAAEVKQKLPADFWERAFRFTIERHPYEKVVSLAFMLLTLKEAPNFDACVVRAIETSASDPQLYFVDGKIAVDRILRYEALDADLAEVTNRLGLPRLTLPRAKSQFRSDRRPAGEILAEHHKRKIADVFAVTFEIMGYQT